MYPFMKWLDKSEQPITYTYFTRLSSIISDNLNILQHIARLVMSNKNKIGYAAIALVAALLATVATVPLKYAAAQNATAQNATSDREEMMTGAMIKAKVAQLKSEHPLFAAVLEHVQSLNAVETLKAILAVHALERILDAHALNLLATAMHNATG
jgi:hypothetical protein